MMKFLGWIALCAVIIYCGAAFAGGKGIEPWQDANRALHTDPAPLVYEECTDEKNPFSDEKVHSCHVLSKYVWVPNISGVAGETITIMFCLKPSTERLIQCFYRADAGNVMVVPILYRGETL